MTYTAPATSILTRLHLADPEIPPSPEAEEPSDGQTACGLVMLCAELWVETELRPGDAVCRQCLGEPDVEQGALL